MINKLSMFRFGACLALVFLALVSTVSAQTEEANRALSVQLNASAASFPVGARIGLNLDVTNSARTQVRVRTEPEEGGFEFVVKQLGVGLSSQPKMTSHLWAARGGRDPIQSVSGGNPHSEVVLRSGMRSYESIDPQMTVRLIAVLNDLFDICTPGEYTIQVKKWRTDPSLRLLQPLDPAPVPIESNPITITITDPPPPTISMQLTMDAHSFSAGSEIDADLAVTNISSASISLPLNAADPAPEYNGFKFLGFKSGNAPNSTVGRLVNSNWRPYDWNYGREKAVRPGQTFHYAVRLSHLLDLSKPGSYTVETETLDPVTHNKVKSSPTMIVVQ